MKTFGEVISKGNGNNLNALRLVLAFLVIVSHSYPLSYGMPEGGRREFTYKWTGGQETLGSIAVDLFFLISGFLITASWLRSKSAQEYLVRRVLRIYPGFICALCFSALVIWLFS